MPKEADNPLEQSFSSRSSRFETFIQSPEKVNQALIWAEENRKAMMDQEIEAADFGRGEIVGIREKWVSFLQILSGSRELRMHIANVINKNPQLLLKIERIVPVPQGSDKIRSKLTTPYIRLLPSIAQEAEANSAKYEVQTERLRNLLEIPDDVPQSTICQLAEELFNLKRDIFEQEFLYYYFLLEQSVAAIGRIAPNVATLIKSTIVSRVIFNISTYPMYNEEGAPDSEDANCTAVGDRYGIRLPEEFEGSNLETNHTYRMFVLVHEILHALLEELLSIPPNFPGYETRFEMGRELNVEKERVALRKKYSLWYTIAEAVSIAFETGFSQGVLQLTNDEEATDKVRKWRRKRLRQVNSIKRQLTSRKISLSDTDLPAGVCYAEGAALAVAWQKNGWELDDLPELSQTIRTLVQEEIGSQYDGILLERIPVSAGNDSQYHRIMSRLKTIKK